MSNATPDEIRVGAYSYQAQRDPSYVETEPAANGKAGRGTVALPVKYRAGSIVVIDKGAKFGRVVYHAPLDGTPALRCPLFKPGRLAESRVNADDLTDGHRGGDFRTLAAARAFMNAVHESGTLPDDRAATAEEVRAYAEWLETKESNA